MTKLKTKQVLPQKCNADIKADGQNLFWQFQSHLNEFLGEKVRINSMKFWLNSHSEENRFMKFMINWRFRIQNSLIDLIAGLEMPISKHAFPTGLTTVFGFANLWIFKSTQFSSYHHFSLNNFLSLPFWRKSFKAVSSEKHAEFKFLL